MQNCCIDEKFDVLQNGCINGKLDVLQNCCIDRKLDVLHKYRILHRWIPRLEDRKSMKKLVIMPAYNESKSIERTVQDILTNAPDFDYVIINDCSTDNTLEVCRKNNFNVVDLPINMGIGGSVQTGYLYAFRNGYDMAVQFDGDGQHDAKYLDSMSEYLTENALDMVIGSRFLEKEGFQSTGARRIGIRYFSLLIRILTGKKVSDPTSGMRLINRRVMSVYAKDYPKDYPEPESVVAILKEGMVVKEVPVVMKERSDGVSSISFKRSVYYMIKVTLAILMECLRH